MDEISFYEKYFKDIEEKIDFSLNSIHIHKCTISNEIDINLNLTKKLIFIFKKLKIKITFLFQVLILLKIQNQIMEFQNLKVKNIQNFRKFCHHQTFNNN